jgi:hypothetical protein
MEYRRAYGVTGKFSARVPQFLGPVKEEFGQDTKIGKMIVNFIRKGILFQ